MRQRGRSSWEPSPRTSASSGSPSPSYALWRKPSSGLWAWARRCGALPTPVARRAAAYCALRLGLDIPCRAETVPHLPRRRAAFRRSLPAPCEAAAAAAAAQTCFKETPEGTRVEACFVREDECLGNRTLFPNATWQTSYSYFVAGTQLNNLASSPPAPQIACAQAGQDASVCGRGRWGGLRVVSVAGPVLVVRPVPSHKCRVLYMSRA